MSELLNPNSHLLNLARSGQRLPHIILAIILAVVFVLASQLIGGVPAALIVLALSMAEAGESAALNDIEAIARLVFPNTALEQIIFLVLAFGPIFLILWVWLALFEKRRLRSIGLEWSGAIQKYVRGLLIGLAMFSASIGLSALFGYIAFEKGDPDKQGLVVLGSVLLVFGGWLVQGAAEEAITRGWLLPTIGARYNPVLGIIVSSVVFAAFHSFNPNLNPIAILNLLLFGLFAALFALYEGSLWGVFSIHSVWNWAQGNLFGFEVSGVFPAGGALFNLMEVGPDVFTGGSFGPEGGLAVTFVLMISCVLVWLVSNQHIRLCALGES